MSYHHESHSESYYYEEKNGQQVKKVIEREDDVDGDHHKYKKEEITHKDGTKEVNEIDEHGGKKNEKHYLEGGHKKIGN